MIQFCNHALHVIVSKPHIDKFAVNFPYNDSVL